jgi:hypothetical protein
VACTREIGVWGKVTHPPYRPQWCKAIVKEKGDTIKREYHPGEEEN